MTDKPSDHRALGEKLNSKAHRGEAVADESVLEQLAVREAIALLREYGVTPERYATWDIEGKWSVSGLGDFPDRETAFAAARARAAETREWSEVWRQWADGEAAESWIVTPDNLT